MKSMYTRRYDLWKAQTQSRILMRRMSHHFIQYYYVYVVFQSCLLDDLGLNVMLKR